MSGPNREERPDHQQDPIRNLRRHQHLCVIYENPQQRMDAVVPFFRVALERGEHCLYLADESTLEEIRASLHEGGVDVDKAAKSEALSVTVKPPDLTNGVFDADGIVDLWRATTQRAKQLGYTGFCAAGEMTWALRKAPDFARLTEYEVKLDDFLTTNDAMMMCLYNRSRFTAETLLELIKTHPVVVYGGKVSTNPYYIPHRHYLGRSGAELELQRMLEFIRDHQSVVADRKKLEGELNESYNQLRSLAGRLMHAQDQERKRISRQLHETTVQSLIALKMDLARIVRAHAISDTSLAPVLDETLALTDQSLQELRTLSHLLHPPLIEEAGLLAALRWYVAGFGARSGIDVTMDAPSDLERLPEQVEIAIFRIVQEALTNIHRHSGSRSARVSITTGEQTLHLEVADAGKGMDTGTRENISGVGLEGIRERVAELSGTLAITSGPKGTVLSALIPKRRESSWPERAS